MSRALDFLIKVRPGPMQAYFSFLKQAGEHLDPKTAALISVITKVYAKTPTGLRQYLPRALKAGATADEVIDALLMAMPALSFSKIVWAIDVILDMDLPEFAKYRNLVSAKSEWVEIGNTANFPVGEAVYVRSGKQPLVVYRTDSELFVYDAHCPHKGNVIPESGLVGTTLTCPVHEWCFDLQSGKCTSGGNSPLRRFAAKIEGDKVLAEMKT
ncbi:MAG: Rieske 2Fe-2S domain-containing protein [Turneriella sp.]|nr:Rieske 2Fe-2S domain-containing protein [Leptospiraceae bacterium]MCX7633663.1 Rieske 2Fe-2S domain-containing protein [Turneriella sp.]